MGMTGFDSVINGVCSPQSGMATVPVTQRCKTICKRFCKQRHRPRSRNDEFRLRTSRGLSSPLREHVTPPTPAERMLTSPAGLCVIGRRDAIVSRRHHSLPLSVVLLGDARTRTS